MSLFKLLTYIIILVYKSCHDSRQFRYASWTKSNRESIRLFGRFTFHEYETLKIILNDNNNNNNNNKNKQLQ